MLLSLFAFFDFVLRRLRRGIAHKNQGSLHVCLIFILLLFGRKIVGSEAVLGAGAKTFDEVKTLEKKQTFLGSDLPISPNGSGSEQLGRSHVLVAGDEKKEAHLKPSLSNASPTSKGALETSKQKEDAVYSAAPNPKNVASINREASPLDDAVIIEGKALPQEMSEEKKKAIGTGKVPIHLEGPFRSPLANPRFGGPAHVKVGFVVSEIGSFDIQNAKFESLFFLSLTSDKDMPKIDLVFSNGKDVNCEASADAPTFKLFRCRGEFATEVDLRTYPFDTQNLSISIEDKAAGIDQLVFEADKNRTSLNSEFRLSGWSVAAFSARAYKHLYPARFDRDDLYVSRYKFTLSVDRFATSAAFGVFVPAFIIVLISLMGLWCPPNLMDLRANAGAPMLAAAVLFHFSLVQSLPATGYLTRADKLMLGVYVSLLLNMVTTWTLIWLSEKSDEAQKLWFKRFRLWTPPLTALVMAAGSLG